MDTHPKRRKSKDNPYELSKINNEYLISFKDSKKVLQIVEINSIIYESFNKFELEDISQQHKFERHIEHSEMYESTLNKRMINSSIEIEDYVINKILFEELHRAIKLLPITQKRRLKMYFFYDMTLEEISKFEKCSIHSVFVSIERAKEKVKKSLNLDVKK